MQISVSTLFVVTDRRWRLAATSVWGKLVQWVSVSRLISATRPSRGPKTRFAPVSRPQYSSIPRLPAALLALLRTKKR